MIAVGSGTDAIFLSLKHLVLEKVMRLLQHHLLSMLQ